LFHPSKAATLAIQGIQGKRQMCYLIAPAWFMLKKILSTRSTLHLIGNHNMTIERADIEKLAELARIQITEDQITATTKSLGDVLNLVDQLQAADTAGVSPMAHPLDAVQVLRADEVTELNQRDAFQAIAPATENGLYLVPKVIE